MPDKTSLDSADEPLVRGGDARSGSDTARSTRPTPSICRAVVYHSHGHPEPAVWPATIQRVNKDGSLKLFVMGDKGAMLVDHIAEGTGVNQWSWPERV